MTLLPTLGGLRLSMRFFLQPGEVLKEAPSVPASSLSELGALASGYVKIAIDNGHLQMINS